MSNIEPNQVSFQEALIEEGGSLEGLATAIYELVSAFVSAIRIALASGAGPEELSAQESLRAYRPTLPDLQILQEGLRRDIITLEQHTNILERAGYSDTAIGIVRLLSENILPISEAIEAYRRGNIDDNRLRRTIIDAGLRGEDIETIVGNINVLLSPNNLIELWRREEIDDSQLDSALSELGYNSRDRQRIRSIALLVPAPQDVIRFLAREVYTPQLRQSLGLDQDFPTASLPAFRAAGLTETYARDLWAAHWVLPSLTDSYRLFWRDLITRDQLEGILRANDVLPLYRDALVEAAYRVPTRVDARRFHALGLIDEDQLQTIYQRQGFSPDDAALMVRFTVAYNTAPNEADSNEIRQLTRTQIERLYRESIIDRAQAIEDLMAIEYAEADADVLLLLIDIDQAEEARDIQVQTTLRRFRSGAIDYNTAVEQLDALDLAPVERNRQLATVEAELLSRIHLPNRAELDKLYQANIIDRDIYIGELQRLGWPEIWAERWAQLNGSQEAEIGD